MRSTINKNSQRIIQHQLESIFSIGRVGLEKESLRASYDGVIAQTAHPSALGAALTHPHITTDYSEALLEFVTPPLGTSQQALDFLSMIHRFVYANIHEECLWPASMPCRLLGEQSIRIAEYGTSNLGQMKHVYRKGLGYRYGKMMQVIAGVHVNLSVNEDFWPRWQVALGDTGELTAFINDQYFKIIRNLQRVGWLIPYLFGASPAVDKSFTHKGVKDLRVWDADTLYARHATSLRLGDIGYTNHRENEIGIKACYDNLYDYVACLTRAIEKPYAAYEEIGVVTQGEYRQLNANILQIENEYYSTVRPKQMSRANEKPTHALLDRGVRYVEIRALDINPFSAIGVDPEQLHFIEVLFMYCLLGDEQIITTREQEEIDINEYEVAHKGRKQGLHLRRDGSSILLVDWLQEIFSDMQAVAELMNNADTDYSRSLARFAGCIDDREQTLSARVLAGMQAEKLSYYDFIARLGKQYCDHFANGLDSDSIQHFSALAEKSRQQQQQLEADHGADFSQFLEEYFAQSYVPESR